MKVSIAIPYFKAPESLRRLFIGLQGQNIPERLRGDIEVLVVNDEGKTQIPVKLPTLPFYTSILTSSYKGVAGARNIAIKSAKGKYIFFLDQDCIPTPEWIGSMLRRFEQEKHLMAIGGQMFPKASSGIVNYYFNITNRLEEPIIDSQTGEIVTLITGNAAFRRKALKKIGGFDEETFDSTSHGGEDVDLTYRLKSTGCDIRYEPKAIVLHEYPSNFSDIFFKYTNHGRGMRLFCLKHKIKPSQVRQPNFSLWNKFCYFLFFWKTIRKSCKQFVPVVSIFRLPIFIFFDLIRYFGHGYGYYNKNYQRRVITTQ